MKEHCEDICEKLLRRFQTEGHGFIQHIVTGDENVYITSSQKTKQTRHKL